MPSVCICVTGLPAIADTDSASSIATKDLVMETDDAIVTTTVRNLAMIYILLAVLPDARGL